MFDSILAGYLELQGIVYFLAWRDMRVGTADRYRFCMGGYPPIFNNGLLCHLLKPAKLPSEQGVPYPIMVYTALLPWQFFVGFLSTASNSLMKTSALSQRSICCIIIPASKAIVSFVDFILSFIILIGLMVFTGLSLQAELSLSRFLFWGSCSLMG